MSLPPSQHVSKPIAPDFQVALGCPLRLLSEGVQHVHAFGERCQVEDAILASSVDPNFSDTGAD
jgi:hypothetical protein